MSASKMGDDCGDLRTWEENIYWSYFQPVQFLQTLTGRYHQQLAIPQKFVNNLREKLAGEVVLKGPSGILWNVGITASNSTLYFKNGWKEFVDDHSLEENDALVFKYIGNSRFDVLMFDQENLCEREGSYFIRRCENVEVESNRKRKDKSPETVEATSGSSHDLYECTPTRRPRKNDAGTSRSVGRPTKNDVGTSRSGGRPLRAKRGCKGLGQPSIAHGQGSSNKKPATEEEKGKALKKACAAASEDSFVMVMRRSHVYTGFYMSIPSEWATKHLPGKKSQYLTLQVKEKTWLVRFHIRESGVGLAGGWKRFVAENCLEESDVCLFNLTTNTTDAIVMDVGIFRVGEDNQDRIPSASRVVVGGLGRRGRPPAK